MNTNKELDYLDKEVDMLEAMGPKQETPTRKEFKEISNCKKATWQSQKLRISGYKAKKHSKSIVDTILGIPKAKKLKSIWQGS